MDLLDQTKAYGELSQAFEAVLHCPYVVQDFAGVFIAPRFPPFGFRLSFQKDQLLRGRHSPFHPAREDRLPV